MQEVAGDTSESGAAPGQSGSRARALPWSRALLLLAVAGPPLWLGGVKPWIVPAFAVVVFGLLLRRCLRSEAPLRVPAMWWLGLAAAGLTALQWIWLPEGALKLVAPGLWRTVAELIAGTPLDGWHRLSVHPGQTGLELARLLALTGLFLAAAQLSWRLVATYVSLTGTVVAVIGLIQKIAGADEIYGIYVLRQEHWGLGRMQGSPLLTSFVNPNHQSGLLLVGMFCAAAMAVDLRRRARETRGHRSSARLADRAYVAIGALAMQATALVLSMSRAAMLSAIVVGLFAAFLGVRQPTVAGSEPAHGRRRALGLGAVILGMLTLALTQGAWDQLATLRDPASFQDKFRTAREGLGLISLSPVLGIGRGAFVDLFPLVDSSPGEIQFTHLESSPIQALVEWGPVPGGLLVLGGCWWWWRSFRANAGLGRRLGLCGLLALGIHSCADFSLDYLGVSAAAVALAGSLGVSSSRQPPEQSGRTKLIGVTFVGLLIAVSVASVSIPGSWSHRRPRDRAVLAGELAIEPALQQTPLDPFLHLALAREHAQAGAWEAALQRAEVAARLRPASLDAHLIAATAAAELGAPLDSIEHVRRGLEGLREPVPPALIEWLLAGVGRPDQLAALAPADPDAWRALAEAVAAVSPAHARALASARTRTHPEDPQPLRLQVELALQAENQNPALALHHARLLVALQPNDENAHRLRATARFAHGSAKHDAAAVAELEQALDDGRVGDRSMIEELLIMALLRVGDEASLTRAESLLDGLLARRAKPPVRRRREVLAERVRTARSKPR